MAPNLAPGAVERPDTYATAPCPPRYADLRHNSVVIRGWVQVVVETWSVREGFGTNGEETPDADTESLHQELKRCCDHRILTSTSRLVAYG